MSRFPWPLLLLLSTLAADARTWTDRTGQYHAEGEMVGAAGQKIWLSTARARVTCSWATWATTA